MPKSVLGISYNIINDYPDHSKVRESGMRLRVMEGITPMLFNPVSYFIINIYS